jgi:hypothetical protein
VPELLPRVVAVVVAAVVVVVAAELPQTPSSSRELEANR